MIRNATIALGAVALLWWSGCTTAQPEQNGLSDEELKHFEQLGAEAASAAFAGISGKLQAAVADSGFAHAVEYCSLKALPLTDSISKSLQCRIRRTAIRWRNPINAPTPVELAELERFDSLIQSGVQTTPVVRLLEDDKVAWYGPIITAKLCTSCHGDESQIDPHVAEHIRRHYPLDRAKDFKEGDLRGMWSIVFDR